MKSKLIKILGLITLLAMVLSACAMEESNELTAAGYLSAVQASVAPELSGKVVEVNVIEGQTVTAGQPLFRIDDEFLVTQRDQASAAVLQAEAGIEAAKKQAASAQLQYELALQGARVTDIQTRNGAWSENVDDDFRPAWYFQKSELIEAAKTQAAESERDLSDAQDNLEAELEKASSNDFIAAEDRLAQAQFAYSTAQQVLARAKIAVFGLTAEGFPADGDETTLTDSEQALLDAAQEGMDAAQSEMDAALLEYNRMLTSSAADAVIQARARVAVAQSNYDSANDALLMLQTGENSLQVAAARAAVEAAESMIGQAEAGLAQAQQAVKLAELQLERAVVKAPLDGVVTARSLEVGELAVAGGTVMQIAQLDTLELIVYLPEDQYGRVSLGDRVALSVDAYAGQQFTGTIIHIADEAEFTPRNVQTEEGRKATVYAVKIQVENPDHKLKPGMPADASFTLK